MVQYPFKNKFTSPFLIDYSLLLLTNGELKDLDAELSTYDQLFFDPLVEKNLISKNELLSSFAISKAENSTLTLSEAQEVYSLVLNDPNYTFIKKKIEKNKQPSQKDYEKLEFLNIVKTVRKYNQNLPNLQEITPDFIRSLHIQLTQGLDFFAPYLPGFTVYKSGLWRDNDAIRVADYEPAPYKDIISCVEEVLSWFNKNQTITNVGVFHTILYAIHPFNNGNKRVARVLEHILLRIIGINSKNLYSTSYYYHQEKARYYKYLLYSLEKKNLNYFVSFFQEAIALSTITVIQSGLEAKRFQFVKNTGASEQVRTILQMLIKRRELQFGTLFKLLRNKMAKQTFVNYLQQAVDAGLVTKRQAGRATYYKLNAVFKEEEIFDALLEKIRPRLSYIPDAIKLS